MSLKSEIPQRAFINAEIIQLVKSTKDFMESLSNVESKYGLDNYNYVNPAHIVSLLYCLFVVPKELWIKKDKAHCILASLPKNEIKRRISELSYSNAEFNNDFSYNFIHKLRNSIAHANYKISKDMEFEFWDIYEDKEKFRCKISIDNISWLISVIGSQLANIRCRT